MAPQQLGDGEDQVGGGRTFGHLAVKVEPHHRGEQHRQRLTEHGGLRLDPSDPPAEDPESVHHRGVRVGADERVRERLAIRREHDTREVLQVHLVADTGPGGDDLESVEGLLRPAQQVVPLDVALVLDLDVLLERTRAAGALGDHRMVDHELARDERVDPRGVAPER